MMSEDGSHRSTHARTIRVCIDVRALATGHARRGIGTYVSTLMGSLDSMASRANVDRAIEDVELHFLRDAGDLSALYQARCHAYHATTLEGLILSPRFRTVATLYDLIPLRLPDWRRHGRRPLAALAYQRRVNMVRDADHVVAISEATKHDARELLGIPAERISVVYPALDPARAHLPTREQVIAAHSELGVQEPYFLTVASSERHKNLLRVLEAFAAFRDRVPEGRAFHLYLAGTWMGGGERRLRRVIDRLRLGPAVRHLPWVPTDQMAALYHGATALVFPSLVEGFGLPVLEAMACGTPVITSNRSSLPEVAGDAAVYVNPEDAGEIGAALVSLAADHELCARLRTRGLERSRLFRPERTANELIALYRRLAEDRRSQ
jgi:glycosyltransferase involved in cell wall biosynthesis